jgi:hypothetical protein
MKRAKLSLLLILVLCTLGFNSCKNEIIDFNTVNYLTATVDGVEESSLAVGGLITGGQLAIVCKLNGTEVITLAIKNAKVGTFDVVADNLLLGYTTDSTYGNSYLGTTGTVKISSLTTTTASGTFEFIGTDSKTSDTKTITSGLFKCTLK